MHSAGQNNTFALLVILHVLLWSDCQNINFVACQSFAQCLSLHKLRFDRICHNSIKLIHHFSISIRVAICKVNVIIFIHKIVTESQSIQGSEPFLAIFLYSVVVIRDFAASTVPTDTLDFRVFLGVNQHFHAFVVQRVWFAKVQNRKPNTISSFCIWSPKEKPLSVSICIDIILQSKVIIFFVYFQCSRQISRFKPTFKYQSFVGCIFSGVKWLDTLQIHKGFTTWLNSFCSLRRRRILEQIFYIKEIFL